MINLNCQIEHHYFMNEIKKINDPLIPSGKFRNIDYWIGITSKPTSGQYSFLVPDDDEEGYRV